MPHARQDTKKLREKQLPPLLRNKRNSKQSTAKSSENEDSGNTWFYALSCHEGSGRNHHNSFHLAVSYYKLEMVERTSYVMIAVPFTLKVGFLDHSCNGEDVA